MPVTKRQCPICSRVVCDRGLKKCPNFRRHTEKCTAVPRAKRFGLDRTRPLES
jgi:hypothetical protein